MAEATAEEDVQASEMLRYYCHQCACPIDLSTADLLKELACPKCESGFIEEITPELEASHTRATRRSTDSNQFFVGGFFGGSGGGGSSRGGGFGRGARSSDLSSLFSNVLFSATSDGGGSGDPDHDLDPVQLRDEESDNYPDDTDDETNDDGGGGPEDDVAAARSGRLFGGHRRRRGLESDESRRQIDRNSAFPRFLEQLLGSLTGGSHALGGDSASGLGGVDSSHSMFPFLSSPFVHSDPRDYAWGTDGLDDVITQLLNQLEGTGPPPAATELIDTLPAVPVLQEHIDTLQQCSVCMEDLVLDTIVISLPCHHLYHKECITPWLQLHGTCPICRQSLAGEATAPTEAAAAAAVGGATEQLAEGGGVKPGSCSGSDDGSMDQYSCHSSCPEDYSLIVDQQATTKTTKPKTNDGRPDSPNWTSSSPSPNHRVEGRVRSPGQSNGKRYWMDEFLDDTEDSEDIGGDVDGDRGRGGAAASENSTSKQQQQQLNINKTLLDLSSDEEDDDDVGVYRRSTVSSARPYSGNSGIPGPVGAWNTRSDRYQGNWAWEKPATEKPADRDASSAKARTKKTSNDCVWRPPNSFGFSGGARARIQNLSSSSSDESADEEKDDGKNEERK